MDDGIEIRETPLSKSIANFENKSEKRTRRERCVVIASDGSVVFGEISDTHSIHLTNDQLAQLAGNVFIHNHIGGTSFSFSDVICACYGRVAEFRIVSRGARYVLRSPEGGFSPEFFVKESRRLR